MPPSRRQSSAVEQHTADRELVSAAVAGDEQARRQIAQRLYARVHDTVRYLRGARPDTPDLVQCCLVELLRALPGFRGQSRLETWSDRVSVRTTLRELKREARTRERAAEAPVAEGPPPADPEQLLRRDRLQERVGTLLQKLRPRRRVVMVLRAVHGYTMPEIAEVTGARLHDVQNDYRAARAKLRRLIGTDPLLREWAEGRRS